MHFRPHKLAPSTLEQGCKERAGGVVLIAHRPCTRATKGCCCCSQRVTAWLTSTRLCPCSALALIGAHCKEGWLLPHHLYSCIACTTCVTSHQRHHRCLVPHRAPVPMRCLPVCRRLSARLRRLASTCAPAQNATQGPATHTWVRRGEGEGREVSATHTWVKGGEEGEVGAPALLSWVRGRERRGGGGGRGHLLGLQG